MSEQSKRNAAFNAASQARVRHAKLDDLSKSTRDRMSWGGVRGDIGRTEAQATEMLGKVPPSQRAGADARAAAENTRQYLSDKDASHIRAHKQGGSDHPNNMTWENSQANRARGGRNMTPKEQAKLGAKWHVDNITGAVKAGIQAIPMGAAIGAVTTAPFSILTNALRVVRGEISETDAIAHTLKDTAVGGTVGGVSAFTVTTLAAACPPIAMALSAASPVLLTVGAAGMVYEFFHILESHKEEVRRYYKSLTRQELEHLQSIEDELIEQHRRNLAFLDEAKAVNDYIHDRPCEPGIEGALKRYAESRAIAQSLGAIPNRTQRPQFGGFQNRSLLPGY